MNLRYTPFCKGRYTDAIEKPSSLEPSWTKRILRWRDFRFVHKWRAQCLQVGTKHYMIEEGIQDWSTKWLNSSLT